MTKNKGGAPRSYSEEQLLDTLRALIVEGCSKEDLTPALVKQELVARHEVPQGMDVRTLEKAIRDGLDVLKTREEDRFLSEVDEADDASIREIVTAVSRQLRIQAGKMRVRHRDVLQQEIEGQRTHVAQLEHDVVDARGRFLKQAEEVRALENEKSAWEAEREALKAKQQDLEKECHGLRAQLELLERLGVTAREDAA